jgi:hypothetical protein
MLFAKPRDGLDRRLGINAKRLSDGSLVLALLVEQGRFNGDPLIERGRAILNKIDFEGDAGGGSNSLRARPSA